MMKKGVYWYVAPFYGQAKEIVWQDPEMLSKYCPPEIWKNRNNSELFIPFPNGSVLFVKGADKPDSLRGTNPVGTILDEYGDIKKEVWQGFLQPVVTANPGAWVWFVGTPKGRNDFWEKLQIAKNTANWQYSILKASESGIINKDALEEARLTTTEAFFKQEYECDFLDDATGVFKGFRQILWDGNIREQAGRLYRVGADLGKYNDYTVLTTIDLHDWKIGTPERFNQIDWVLQKAKIEAYVRRYNNATCVLDSTGLGDPIYDDLEKQGVGLEPFKFNMQSRNDLLNNLIVMIENRQILLPNYEPLLEELSSMKYELKVSDGGRQRITMSVPEGLHDDCIMSLGLACWGLRSKLPIEAVFSNNIEFGKQSDYDDKYGRPMRY